MTFWLFTVSIYGKKPIFLIVHNEEQLLNIHLEVLTVSLYGTFYKLQGLHCLKGRYFTAMTYVAWEKFPCKFSSVWPDQSCLKCNMFHRDPGPHSPSANNETIWFHEYQDF
jgi:hypothetical protein